MDFFSIYSPSRKHRQVIEIVVAYFNQEISNIPYSPGQIKKTIDWLANHEMDKDNLSLLKEKLNMAAKIAASHHHQSIRSILL